MRFLALIIFLSLLITSAFGGTIELPRGGKFYLDSSKWEILENTNLLKENLFMVSRSDSSLTGAVLDGTIKNISPCADVGKSWKTCRREVLKGSNKVQIYLVRKIGPQVFQSYIFSFNVSKDKDNRQLKLIDELESKMVIK